MKLVLRYGINKNLRRFGVDIVGNYKEFEEVYNWCCEQFGDRNERYNNPRWKTTYHKDCYWFQHEKDRDWFVLKWS